MPGASGRRQGVVGCGLNINRHRDPFLFLVWSHLLWTAQIQPHVHPLSSPIFLPSSFFYSSTPLHSTPPLIQPLYSLSMKPRPPIPDSIHPSAPPVRDRATGERGESDGRGVRNHLDDSLMQHNKMDMQVARFSRLLVRQNGCQQVSTWQEI